MISGQTIFANGGYTTRWWIVSLIANHLRLANAWAYMAGYQPVIELSQGERDELTVWSEPRSLWADGVFKARLILDNRGRQELQHGGSRSEHIAPNGCALEGRFEQFRMAGPDDRTG